MLTAETLRNDLTELWVQRRIPTKGIVMVSHNIEEAVEMADRILIFSSDPGRISAEVPVPLPRPRDWESPAVPADHGPGLYAVDDGARAATGGAAPSRSRSGSAIACPTPRCSSSRG